MENLFQKFLDFAKAKPADEEFDHYDGKNCALAQFGKIIDPDFIQAGYYGWQSHGLHRNRVISPDSWGDSERVFEACHSRTWGELVAKLESE